MASFADGMPLSIAAMAILVLFVLGTLNFALHRAVLESGHPLLGQVPWFFHMLNGRFSLVVEFGMLLAAMLMTASGAALWTWGYGCYSLANVLGAWLILTDRH
jgi:hypothetical protein